MPTSLDDPSRPTVSSSNGRTRRVLFLDDEQEVVDGLARALRPAPDVWDFEFFTDPWSAIDRIATGSIEIVVTDMRMPGMGGGEFLKKVEAVSPDTVRLMLSGHADFATAMEAVNEGHVFHLMVKPCERGELLRVLNLAYRQHELQTSERQLLRARLEHSERIATVGQFTAGVVHDLNNLLGGILCASEPDSPLDPDEAKELVYATAGRAAELTRELMLFCRRDEDQPPKPLDLSSIVTSCARILTPTLHHRVILELDLPGRLPLVLGHAGKLKQVVTNLVLNARDATADQGRIVVSAGHSQSSGAKSGQAAAERPGEYVWLAVADTGCGMDEATRRRLFEPFFTTKAEGKGTGLGLSLVRQLVEEHGGWIEVESEPGAGSTFRVHLPVAAVA